MPPKKVTLPAFKQMEAKVVALESEISDVRSTLVDVQNEVRENHASLLAMLERCLRKSVQEEEDESMKGSSGPKGTSEKKGSQAGDPVTEFRHAVRKVELPLFNGEDPAGWISRAEIYFRVQETTPEVKVRLAQICMEGPTIHFFNSLVGEDEGLTWESLKEALLGRYGGHGEGDVYEQLSELKQGGSVDEYITEFEYLIAQIPKLPEKQFLGYFLHGLKKEIRGKVRSLATMGEMSRTKLLQVTRAVEKEVSGVGLSPYHGSRQGSGSHRPNSHGSGKPNSDWVLVQGRDGETRGGAKSNPNGPRGDKPAQTDQRRVGPRDRGYTHLSYQEMMDRKLKGRCFKCNGPFHPMHQCPNRQLRVLILDDNEVGEDSEKKLLAVEVEESEDEENAEMSILNLNHIAFENHQTVKFQGQIHGVPVLVMVDSGATHNFISQKLVQKMEWPIEETPMMGIKLGDGFRKSTKGVCSGLKLKIGEFEISPRMHLFELGGIDVVLGIEWLKTLGDMIVNWHK